MIITKREILSLFRNKLREVTADSDKTDKFLYYVLEEHAKWMIPREIKSGKIMQSKSIFQKVYCMPTIQVDRINDKCPIHIEGLTIYRSEFKLPPMWENEKGPIIKRVLSIDDSVEFKLLSQSEWEVKYRNPYMKKSKEVYCFFDDGYLWFPKENPRRLNIEAFFKEDVSNLEYCKCGEKDDSCTIYLDTLFAIPNYLQSELLSKAFEQIAGQTNRIQKDTNIDKNTTINQ